MAAEIKSEYPDARVKLIEASGGLFEVTMDGDLIFSKKQLDRHAEPGEVLDLLREAAN